ncbi:unnamed protein product, partial [Protopolystoma xenopodis]
MVIFESANLARASPLSVSLSLSPSLACPRPLVLLLVSAQAQGPSGHRNEPADETVAKPRPSQTRPNGSREVKRSGRRVGLPRSPNVKMAAATASSARWLSCMLSDKTPAEARFHWACVGILDCLTPADLRWLVDMLDEQQRAGGFQCVFPPAANLGLAARYLGYFEMPRYANLLCIAFLHNFLEDKDKADTGLGRLLFFGLPRRPFGINMAMLQLMVVPMAERCLENMKDQFCMQIRTIKPCVIAEDSNAIHHTK